MIFVERRWDQFRQWKRGCVKLLAVHSRDCARVKETVFLFVKMKGFLKGFAKGFAIDASVLRLARNEIERLSVHILA
ncbi:hypothetical protein GIB67_006293 [Kingdonia uniflora]|uniref:Uncharacterized protein n=1 Tax=Kingdonia uniflora TaxID=39325 RepID=A0A7J7P5E5_9MAGN|nr:hypothetical protein GIB67_006293 [Kingdonia uniflora]